MPLFTDLRSLEKLIKPQLGKEKPVHPHWDDKAVGKGLCGAAPGARGEGPMSTRESLDARRGCSPEELLGQPVVTSFSQLFSACSTRKMLGI